MTVPPKPPAPGSTTPLWQEVQRLVDRLGPEVSREHGLGPLAARRLRELGQEPPVALMREERAAATANLVAPTLLANARTAYDGRLLLFKGPELSRRYPGRARRFGDLDLLADDPEAAQAALLAGGFQLQERNWPPLGYDDVRRPHYHLHPLVWPGLALRIEVHKRVKWPDGLTPPSNDEIFEAAVPASVGVDGLLAPHPQHHAVLLASHAWGEIPMRRLRELVDVMVFVGTGERGELERVAAGWGFARGWRTTLAVADWMLDGAEEPTAVKVWARYLRDLREPTVIEMHVQEWLAPYWMAPPARALRRTGAAIARDLRPEPEQTWRQKLAQTGRALLHPLSAKSEHERRSGRRRARGSH